MEKQRPEQEDILATIQLEQIEENVFEGLSPKSDWGRIFGGQVLGQGITAAQKTVVNLNERPTHSFSSHFLRPGNPDIPIRFEVENIRDGRSFSTRHVRATQNGKGILIMTASFQDFEEGFEHQSTMPKVPTPEEVELSPEQMQNRLESMPEAMRKHMSRPRSIDMRFITDRDMINPKAAAPEVDLWFRATDTMPIPDNRAVQAAVFSYASDMSFMDTAMVPHGSSLMDPTVHGVSLDHSVWFHDDIDMNDWLLFTRESPWARHGRGYVRGMVYNRAGLLVASVVQECLIRKMPAK